VRHDVAFGIKKVPGIDVLATRRKTFEESHLGKRHRSTGKWLEEMELEGETRASQTRDRNPVDPFGSHILNMLRVNPMQLYGKGYVSFQIYAFQHEDPNFGDCYQLVNPR
jgi:hypothetical protein